MGLKEKEGVKKKSRTKYEKVGDLKSNHMRAKNVYKDTLVETANMEN